MTNTIVHIGPGAFFRAFIAPYIQDCDDDWNITAISLRSSTFHDQVMKRNGVYTTATLSTSESAYQEINVVKNVITAPNNSAKVIKALCAPNTKIVTLTITEKGYCHVPSTGRLNLSDPEIKHDLQNPNSPKTAIGLITTALAERRQVGVAPFTILSCDNLPSNGKLCRQVILDFARAIDSELAVWIDKNCKFPSTMVDRITPATTSKDVDIFESARGYRDEALVVHEPFRQWVIEDDFVDDVRPKLEHAGVQFVRDVAPFEMMKLRCLNGTHSALAYLGFLSGTKTVAQASTQEPFISFLKYLWKIEIVPTLTSIDEIDFNNYTSKLLERYQNSKIHHKTLQIAMDGSQKLPQRILEPIAENISAGRPIVGLCLVVAAWTRFAKEVDERGERFQITDPMAETLKACANAAPNAQLGAFLNLDTIFETQLKENPIFSDGMRIAYEEISSLGCIKSMQNLLASTP